MSSLTIRQKEKLEPVIEKLLDLSVQFTKNILEIGNIIHQANKDKDLREGDVLKMELVTVRKIMSESQYSYFKTIGDNRELHKPEISKFLPNSQDSLRKIASLIPPITLRELIKNGTVNTSMTVQEVNNIINNLKNTKKNTTKKGERLFTISISYDNLKKYKKEIKTIKTQILKLFPFLNITK